MINVCAPRVQQPLPSDVSASNADATSDPASPVNSSVTAVALASDLSGANTFVLL